MKDEIKSIKPVMSSPDEEVQLLQVIISYPLILTTTHSHSMLICLPSTY